MSVLFKDNVGTLISHEVYVNNCVKDVLNLDNIRVNNVKVNPKLFNIVEPYKKNFKMVTSLSDEVKMVKNSYESFVKDIKIYLNDNEEKNTGEAYTESEKVYKITGENPVKNAFGHNSGSCTVKLINNTKYIFPENCSFYCKDVKDIEKYLESEQFDVILLDPPWWNKYIRRKRKRSENSYNMMYNSELKKIPIETMLKNDGLLIIWCTNSQQNITDLKTDIFSKWNVQYIKTWYWLKITKSGLPICNFAEGSGKQPFERIIFASQSNKFGFIPDEYLLVSVPSALHSHKPPLDEVLKPFLNKSDPKCLEIFARYLLPNWHSYGNEVLRFQHEYMFIDM